MADIKEKVIIEDGASATLKKISKEANATSKSFDKLKEKLTFNDPKLSSGIKNMQNQMGTIKSQFSNTFPELAGKAEGVANIFKSVTKINPVIAGAVAGIAAFTAGIQMYFATAEKYVNAFQESMQGETSLALASLSRRGTGNVSDITGIASDIQGRGIVGADELVMGATTLMRAGNVKQAEQFQSTLADMMVATKGFNATGADAEQSAEAINKALNGQIKGLQQYGVYLDTDAKKRFQNMSVAERSVFIQDQLSKSIGGLNETFGKSSLGIRKQFRNAFGDIEENIGAWFSNALGSIYGTLNKYTGFFSEVGEMFGRGMNIIGNVLAAGADIIFSVGEALWDIAGALLSPIVNYFGELGNMVGLGGDLTESLGKVIRVIGVNISYFAKMISGVADIVSDGLNSIVDAFLIGYYAMIDTMKKALPESLTSKFDFFNDANSKQATIYERMQARNNKSIIDNITNGILAYGQEVTDIMEGNTGKKDEFNLLADLFKSINKNTGDTAQNTKKLGEVDSEYLQAVRDYFVTRNSWTTNNSTVDSRTYNVSMMGKGNSADDITTAVDGL